AGISSSADSADFAQGVRPARKPPRAGSDLDPAELRHRYDERAAVYEYEAGLPRPEAELRAWLDAALDYIEADPERDALPNREARALAARVLAAAGIPEPPATTLPCPAAPSEIPPASGPESSAGGHLGRPAPRGTFAGGSANPPRTLRPGLQTP